MTFVVHGRTVLSVRPCMRLSRVRPALLSELGSTRRGNGAVAQLVDLIDSLWCRATECPVGTDVDQLLTLLGQEVVIRTVPLSGRVSSIGNIVNTTRGVELEVAQLGGLRGGVWVGCSSGRGSRLCGSGYVR